MVTHVLRSTEINADRVSELGDALTKEAEAKKVEKAKLEWYPIIIGLLITAVDGSGFQYQKLEVRMRQTGELSFTFYDMFELELNITVDIGVRDRTYYYILHEYLGSNASDTEVREVMQRSFQGRAVSSAMLRSIINHVIESFEYA